MDELPSEILFRILLDLQLAEVLNYGCVDRAAQTICQSDYLWQEKAQIEHSLSLDLVNETCE